jgi:O-antigen/teichoic acid export membrane protein
MTRPNDVLISLGSQTYATAIGLLLLPAYRQILGDEGFGLIALSIMLQGWIILLDFGMAPTITRLVARFRAGRTSASELLSAWKFATTVYLIVGTFAGLGFAALIVLYGAEWITPNHLTAGTLTESLLLILGIFILRLWSELFRAVLIGNESFYWLGWFSIFIGTARFLIVLPLVVFVSSDIRSFFICQLLIGFAEACALFLKAHALLPTRVLDRNSFSIDRIKDHRIFIFSVATTGLTWVVVSQIDRLLLSGLLSLADYGRFTFAFVAASAITVLTAPLSPIILTRLTVLRAKGVPRDLNRGYAQASQWLGLLAWPLASILFFYGKPLLWVWTGDLLLADELEQIVQLYALGNAFLAINAVAYFAQYSSGSLRLHILASTSYLVIIVPAITWGTTRYGITGAAWVWLLINIGYFFSWVPIAHRYFVFYSYGRWLLRDILPIPLAAFGIAWLTTALELSTQRFLAAIYMSAIFCITFAVTYVVAPRIRKCITRCLPAPVRPAN